MRAINVSAQQHAGIAHEGGKAADALWPVLFRQPAVAPFFTGHEGNGEEGFEALADADRAGAGAAAAMGGGKGLVQVEMDHIEAHVARLDPAQDGVEIGAIVIQQPAGFVHDTLDVLNAFLEHAQGGRVGQHQAGGLRADGGFQRGQIDVAIAVGGDLAHRVAAHHRRGRIGAVGAIRHQDLAARRVAARVVVGADHRHAGKFALCPGHRGKRNGGHAGHFLEHFLQIEHRGQKPLPGVFRAHGVACQQLRQHGKLVAGARVVLHGAGTERVEMGVDGEVLLRQPGVMAHRIHFGNLRQQRRRLAPQMGRDVSAGGQRGRRLGGIAAFGLGAFEDQHVIYLH